MALNTRGSNFILDHPQDDESECSTCEYYETCLLDPNFDEKNGICGDYRLKLSKESIVVE